MAYISYLDLPKHWGLHLGDSVLLTSDIMQLMFTAMRNGERFDRDAFLNAILEVIGKEGTLLIPTFNWDFCHGIPFDYHKTPCKVLLEVLLWDVLISVAHSIPFIPSP